MARAPSSIVVFIRQNPRTRQNPNTQIRSLTFENKEGDCGNGETKPNPHHEPSQNAQNEFTEIAKEVSKTTRTKPRWEQTLLSDFPSFNFSDHRFLNEVMKHQNNVLLSLHFFHRLCSHRDFSPATPMEPRRWPSHLFFFFFFFFLSFFFLNIYFNFF
jgi:hypothetical protein